MSNERSAEMFSRVRMMASGNDKWDLSDNDIAALKHVLAAAEAREAGEPTSDDLKELNGIIAGLEFARSFPSFLTKHGKESIDGKYWSAMKRRGEMLDKLRATNPPTAAEVIAAAEKAMEALAEETDGSVGADTDEAYRKARAACARWKEASGGMPIL